MTNKIIDWQDYKALENKLNQRIDGKSRGNWWLWQVDKIRQEELMPRDHHERFSQFIAETAPPLQDGECHLHAFYDKIETKTIWRIGYKGTTMCGTPRCKPIKIELL